MTWTYDANGKLNLSDLSMEERVEVIQKIHDHLVEIRDAWFREFLPERVELESGKCEVDEMNEVEIEELNSILSRYEDNQIWTLSPAEDTNSGTVFPLDGLETYVYGRALLLGEVREIWDGYDYRKPVYFYVSEKPKVEVADYQKLIEAHHPKSSCETGCNCSTYEYVWEDGSFGCPFCEAELECDHESNEYKEAFTFFEAIADWWDFDAT